MSARVMKKIQEAQAAAEAKFKGANDDENESDDDNGDWDNKNKKHLNPFDLLNQQSQSESEVKEDDNETEHASSAASATASNTTAKKKKKKRKKKSKSSSNQISSEDNDFTEKILHVDMQYYDIPKPIDEDKLLIVELKHLNSQNEMRRTFGKRVVKTDQKRGRQKVTLKTTHMVKPKESWPPLTNNLMSMKQLTESRGLKKKNPDEPIWFTFQHSEFYSNIEYLFLSALERTDSDILINLIRRCPYHVDSLIQLSELCRMTEDFALASELIERALLVLEHSLHINFNLTTGNCHLDYRRQENRAFFIVLFKHAQYLEARACNRTAFEISKVLLNLHPDADPLAVILVIDYYALRCRQASWLKKFYQKYNEKRNLSQLPNMAYSYALALHMLYGECIESNEALQYALLMFPGVLRPLLQEMSVNTDSRILGISYFNSEVSSSQSPGLHQLVSLYVCRAKVIWRNDNVLNWLEINVNAAIERIQNKDKIIAEYKEKRAIRYGNPPRPILRHVILSDFKEKVPLATFLKKEKDPILSYDPLPPVDSVNIYVRKAETASTPPSSLNTLSIFFQSLLRNLNVNYAAPIAEPEGAAINDANAVDNEPPPAIAAATATSDIPVAASELDNTAGGNVNNANVATNDEAAATSSLAPPGEEYPAIVEDDIDAQLQALNSHFENNTRDEPPTAYRDLTQSVTNIVDAMRDFLQNFRVSEALQDDAAAPGQTSTNTEEESDDYND